MRARPRAWYAEEYPNGFCRLENPRLPNQISGVRGGRFLSTAGRPHIHRLADAGSRGSEERLRDFLLFRFGADQRYLIKRGHPRLRGRHMPFKTGIAERDRWINLMGEAADEVIVDSSIRKSVMEFFAQVADFMRNQPEAPCDHA